MRRDIPSAADNRHLPVVLWVEDNHDDVVVMKQAFSDAGLDVQFVLSENAILAFRYMEEREPYISSPRPPDLLLVDLNLPVIRGTTVVIELRKHLAWRNTPLVVLTSTSDPKELRACLDLGATECLTKPPAFEAYPQLVERLRRYLPRAGCTSPKLGREPESPGVTA
jgi:CheY-like chemotaxis protein